MDAFEDKYVIEGRLRDSNEGVDMRDRERAKDKRIAELEAELAAAQGVVEAARAPDMQRLKALAAQIQTEWQDGGLFESIYQDFFMELWKRYFADAAKGAK